MSPFQIVRRFALNLLVWSLIAAAAYAIGTRLPQPASHGAWAGAAALLCAAGALLIRSQPLGQATLAGRVGFFVVHFGFRAGQGKIAAAAVISWLVWVVVGCAVIWSTGSGFQLLRAAMALAWTINVLGLFYVWGIVLRNRPRADNPNPEPMRVPSSLSKLSTVVVTLIAVSAVLWWVFGTPAAQLAALLVAGGPLLVVGGGYGLVLLVMLTAGKNVRWN